ncbi:MAG: response regulator [Deltaproteobacteria bacterium]|nr:response regulator [Deltaproteobacteria bacterium]
MITKVIRNPSRDSLPKDKKTTWNRDWFGAILLLALFTAQMSLAWLAIPPPALANYPEAPSTASDSGSFSNNTAKTNILFHSDTLQELAKIHDPIKIGVLANRGDKVCLEEWVPTAQYLAAQLAPLQFEIVPLDFDEVLSTTKDHSINFIVANPSYYAFLEYHGLVRRIATLQVAGKKAPQSLFGGVIFTRSDRDGISNIQDLENTRFAAVDSKSLGGWHAALREIQAAGIDPDKHFAALLFKGTHDAVVNTVLSGAADAGTVRSTQLERMAAEGRLLLKQIKVIHSRAENFPDYPYFLSTNLYPEWPFAALSGEDTNLSKHISVALFKMDEKAPAAQAVHGAGWAIPEDYASVYALLQDLNLPPFEKFGQVTLRQVLKKYWPWITGFAILLGSSLAFGIYLARLIRKIRKISYALDSNEEHLAATLRSIGDGVISCDIHGKITNLNAMAETLTGWSLDAARGKPLDKVFCLVDEQTGEPLENLHQDCLATGEVAALNRNGLLNARSGRRHHISVSLAPIRQPAGNVIGSVSVFRDVTDEHLANQMTETRLTLIEYAPNHTLDELLTKALDEISALADSPVAFLHFVENDQKSLSLQKWSTRTLDEFCRIEGVGSHAPLEQAGIWADCLRERKTVIQNDYQSLPGKRGLPKGHAPIIRKLVVPIMRKDKIVGILGVGNKATSYNEKDAKRVHFLADVAWQIISLKKAEEALQKSEAFLSTLLDTIPIPVFYKGTDGRYMGMNKNFADILGQSKEKLIGKSVFDISPPGLANVYHDADLELLEKPGVRIYESQFPDASGRLHDIIFHKATIIDTQGSIIGVIGTLLDFTERKQAERNLSKSLNFLENVLESIQDGVMVLSPELRLIRANSVVKKIFGEKIPFAGKRCFECSSEEKPCDHCPVQHCFESGETETKIIPGPADSPIEWLELFTYPMKNRETGEVESVIQFVRDITSRKRTEVKLLEINEQLEQKNLIVEKMAAKAEAANSAKSEFLANMSHEIRTPMNGIIGMSRFLLDTEMTQKQRHYAETVRSCGESLLTLLNDILDFSKIEAGRLDFETIDFDLGALLNEVGEIISFKVKEKGLEFFSKPAPEVPILLQGDPSRLRQILTNLAGNAVKFTDHGQVSIHVSMESENAEDVLLRFSVRDTGIGVPEDKQKVLFQKFSQVDSSVTRKFGGTGLGLAISKQLAEMMGGEIGLNSTAGQGSEFWFTARFLKQPEQSKILPQADLTGAHILYVDDNATNREIYLAMLKKWGVRVSAAANANRALQMLYEARRNNDPYRAALLDMQMADISGEQLGKIIKADPALAGTNLVMMTSWGQRGDANRLEEIGFSGYLIKPVRQEDLFDSLSAILANGAKDNPKIVTRHSVRESRRDKLHILLAEDNPVNQQVALGILGKLGLKADAVNNGNEVLKACEITSYDLILMDVNMPEIDGLEATKIIRDPQSAIHNPDIPIIAMTAHALQEDQGKCLAAGMNDYLSKPVDFQDFAAMMEKWLPQ